MTRSHAASRHVEYGCGIGVPHDILDFGILHCTRCMYLTPGGDSGARLGVNCKYKVPENAEISRMPYRIGSAARGEIVARE